MSSPLDVVNTDIERLDAAQLVDLLWQLVNLELSTNGVAKYDSHVSLSINIKDGGVDGQARWEDGPTHTTWFPGRFVGFQAKATEISVDGCASEVKTSRGTLKPQVRKLIEGGGTYVLFLGRNCVTASKEKRVDAFRAAIESLSTANGETAVVANDIRIYDASDIASWTNTFPAAVAAVFHCLGKAGSGACGWVEQSGYLDLQAPFVDKDEQRRSYMKALCCLSLKTDPVRAAISIES